jgi:hypothetical protein
VQLTYILKPKLWLHVQVTGSKSEGIARRRAEKAQERQRTAFNYTKPSESIKAK